MLLLIYLVSLFLNVNGEKFASREDFFRLLDLAFINFGSYIHVLTIFMILLRRINI